MERKTRVPVTRNNMWYDDTDFDLDMDICKEFMENDSNCRVVLFRIDRENTQMDDVYGESDASDIRFLTPVELIVSALKIDSPELKNYTSNGGLSYVDKGNMTFGILSTTLTEKDIELRRGDFIGYNVSADTLQYYTVVNDGRINSDNAHTLYGIKPFYRTVTCVTVDPNQFNGL